MTTPLANAIRFLAIDAVQQAQSGHPGMPMGMADIATVLWRDFLQHNPQDPKWPNRDRFVLSNGHGSMLLYALLHLTGYDLSISDLKQFRQWHSKTPGHPECDETPGVETTTGPLGQGLANAVGMAMAERSLAAQFNRPGFELINHHTYVFLGDGCLMEGISHEAASFAGTQRLHKLIAFWDDNGISIDGNVSGWFTDDTPARFRAYGWHVIEAIDGHDQTAIHAAIERAQTHAAPTLICCRTTIGFGAPNAAGTEHCHGSPLGEKEIQLTRQALNWPHAPFEIPADIYAAWDAKKSGGQRQTTWQDLFSTYAKTHPALAQEFSRRLAQRLPETWSTALTKIATTFAEDHTAAATRKTSQRCLSAIAPHLPELIGGSADLTGSNCTEWQTATTLDAEHPAANYLHFGVREFGMSAILNGMALYGGFIPFGGTFLTFSDYARNAVRMAALMKKRVIFVYSHDSIGLGEDGPTHQPIEHAAMLRMTPNVMVWRPADLLETLSAWQHAIEHTTGPSCLLLSRQNLPALPHSAETRQQLARGGYILQDCVGEPEAIVIATGSEVQLALAAANTLAHYKIRVVSMPSTSVFDRQDSAYRDHVLPPSVSKRLSIEAASADFWYKYVGLEGKIIGIKSFGGSAPDSVLFSHFGFTAAQVTAALTTLILGE